MGDEAIQVVANGLSRHIRQTSGDWAARYAGEEFLVCLVNCDRNIALQVAERMRKSIENMNIPIKCGELKITASFGVYTSYNQDLDMYKLIELVDGNLYAAKKNGRNQVCGDLIQDKLRYMF